MADIIRLDDTLQNPRWTILPYSCALTTRKRLPDGDNALRFSVLCFALVPCSLAGWLAGLHRSRIRTTGNLPTRWPSPLFVNYMSPHSSGWEDCKVCSSLCDCLPYALAGLWEARRASPCRLGFGSDPLDPCQVLSLVLSYGFSVLHRTSV